MPIGLQRPVFLRNTHILDFKSHEVAIHEGRVRAHRIGAEPALQDQPIQPDKEKARERSCSEAVSDSEGKPQKGQIQQYLHNEQASGKDASLQKSGEVIEEAGQQVKG